MLMRIYISGKIGEETPSPETLAKFRRVEDMLRSMGYDVFNPTTSGLGAHAESLAKKNGTTFYEEILLLDQQELKKCDGVYMLNDWRLSPGARSELALARALRRPVYGDASMEPWDINHYINVGL
jgi:hypothetical protein